MCCWLEESLWKMKIQLHQINSQMPFWSSSHLQSDSLFYNCVANWLAFLHYSSQEYYMLNYRDCLVPRLEISPNITMAKVLQGVNDTWKKACLNLPTVTSVLIIQSTPITAMKRTTNSYLHSSWKLKRNNSKNFLLAMRQQQPKATWGKISMTQLKTLSSFTQPGRWDFLKYLKNLTVFKFIKFLLI